MDTPVDVSYAQRLNIVYLALQVAGGLIGMPLFLITICCSRKVKRSRVLFSFCASWVLYAFSYTLLLFTGNISTVPPPRALCITQVAMIYASVPSATTSGLAYVLHFFLSIRWLVNPIKLGDLDWPEIYFILPSWIVFIGFTSVIAVLSALKPSQFPITRRPTEYYCQLVLTENKLRAGSLLFTLIIAGLVILMMAVNVRYVVVHHRRFKKIVVLDSSRPALHTFVRVAVLSLFVFLGTLVTSLYYARPPGNYSLLTHLIEASVPFAVFVIFASQKDVFFVWLNVLVTVPMRIIRRVWTRVRTSSPLQHCPTCQCHLLHKELPALPS